MYSRSYKISPTKSKRKNALLFLLAIIMLVVSCPFKRMLQAESNLPVAQQSVKLSGTDRKLAANKNGCTCVQKNKVPLVSLESGKQQLPAIDFSGNENLQSGFGIHYFINGTQKKYSSFVASPASSLPLFLRHRSLLI